MSSSHRVLSSAAMVLVLGASSAGQMLKVGQKAPSFTCQSHEGKDTTFPPKGQWAVLAFYPKAATPG